MLRTGDEEMSIRISRVVRVALPVADRHHLVIGCRTLVFE